MASASPMETVGGFPITDWTSMCVEFVTVYEFMKLFETPVCTYDNL